MGVFNACSGADFSAIGRGFIPPIANGLADWGYLGDPTGAGNLTASMRNLLPSGAPATIVGSPVAAVDCLRITDSSQGFQTGVMDSGDITLFAAVADGATTETAEVLTIAGSENTADTSGWNFGFNSTTSIRAFNFYAPNGNQNKPDPTTYPIDYVYHLVACTIAGTTSPTVTLYDLTTGHTWSPALSSIAHSGLPIEFAGDAHYRSSGSFTSTIKLAFRAVYTRALAVGEIQTLAPVIRQALAKRPTPVVV